MIRALLLILFISCSYEEPQKIGYFRSHQLRTPASQTEKATDYFQAYIYCKTNSEKAKKCFNRLINTKNTELYLQTEKELKKIVNLTFENLLKEKTNQIHDQISGCVQTSKEEKIQECLHKRSHNMFSHLISEFSEKNIDKLNGHEIHFLNFSLEKITLDYYDDQYLTLKSHEEELLKNQLSKEFPSLSKQMIESKSMFKKALSFEEAHEICANSMTIPPLKYLSHEEYRNHLLKDHVCSELLGFEELKNIVQDNSNRTFEKNFNKFLKQFEYEQKLGFYDCMKSHKTKIEFCFEKTWEVTTELVNKKMLNQKNYRNIASDKSYVLTRLNKEKDFLKKKITSSY
jgi:hypothetical protein